MPLEWAALWSGFKVLASAAKEAGKLDLYEKALDLQQQAQELFEENRELKERVRELEERMTFGASLRYERNAYWSRPDYSEESGPYCVRCYDDERKGMRMIRVTDGYAQCPKCSTTATLSTMSDRESRGAIGRTIPDDY